MARKGGGSGGGTAGEGRAREVWRVTGEVQGVGFRWRTRRVGEETGVDAYAENLFDGSVRLTMEGERHALAAVRARLAVWFPEAGWELVGRS